MDFAEIFKIDFRYPHLKLHCYYFIWKIVAWFVDWNHFFQGFDLKFDYCSLETKVFWLSLDRISFDGTDFGLWRRFKNVLIRHS
jgi:hypothetical protein